MSCAAATAAAADVGAEAAKDTHNSRRRAIEIIFFSLFTISKYVCMVPEILFMPKRSVFQWLNKQALNDNVNSAIKSFNFPRFTLS